MKDERWESLPRITRSRLELLSTSRMVDLRSSTQQQDASTRPVTAGKVSSGRARLMRGLRVVTGDDELLALDDLARMLVGHPNATEVLTASSGAEALLTLNKRAHDRRSSSGYPHARC
jgi:hypothetical protein